MDTKIIFGERGGGEMVTPAEWNWVQFIVSSSGCWKEREGEGRGNDFSSYLVNAIGRVYHNGFGIRRKEN